MRSESEPRRQDGATHPRAVIPAERRLMRDRRRDTGPARWSGALLVVGLGLWSAVAVGAQDPPHWQGDGFDIDCTSQCHTPHVSLGDNLTQTATNANLCQSCHNPTGWAADLPISNSDKAIRGIAGTSHAFEVDAVQDFDGDAINDTLAPLADPLAPSDARRDLRVPGGKIVCSTCHNQHKSEKIFGGESRVGTARQATSLGSTGTISAGSKLTGFNAAQGAWYLVQIVVSGDDGSCTGGTDAKFCFSKDNGTTWFPGACDPPAAVYSPNLTANCSTPVDLDSNVTVVFSPGNYVQNERWQFSAAWPYLRRKPPATADALIDSGANSTGDVFCRDCHRPWVMEHGAVETWNGQPKSHPVGIALNANLRGYDRASPRDGNGQLQGNTGAGVPSTNPDGVASNDLLFDASGRVQCLTCHAVHFVDGSTETEDGP